MSGTNQPVKRVLDGIDAALAAGFEQVKVNTVVERGVNDGQILPLVRYFKDRDVTVRFIEYMDVGGANAWSNATVLTARETRELIETEFPLVPVETRNPSATAVNYRHADGGGEVGFIASVSQPFCGDCSRARVSVDGQLYTCLFATHGTDLRPWLSEAASAEQLAEAVKAQWLRRDDQYSEQRGARREAKSGKHYPTVMMSRVGG